MKKIALLLILLLLLSCSSDDESEAYTITLSFSHNWDGITVTSSDFNVIKFTNANGEELSIERLRYLISDLKLEKSSGETIIIDGYNLIDVTNGENLEFSPSTTIPKGTYSKVSFVFGFTNEKNSDGVYPDLNSASWNVPVMLGGGYHYMQLDGKFINSNSEEHGYNYHAIRAADNPGSNPTFPQDTFFEVNLGSITVSNDTTLNIEMNIAEWFKNPNVWDLNTLNQMLMPNSSAQILMHANGQNVFSLKSID
ncbi:MbnP family protein [Seonamhaeicola sp. ML3]|uniref:MbnP family protein n=1 Tax=Seonamhaeicola sp. ML3 TaxID=2937786 RepID=UPI00200D9A40|nr:MbnP family protein [Seonamhaeicola sp. ML3]